MKNELLFRCHCIADFASEPKKDKAKDYYKAVEDLAHIKNSTRKLTVNQEQKLIDLPPLIKSLEKYKDQNTFSLSAQKRMRRMVREEKYGIVDNLDNKYLNKGLMCEDEAISLLSKIEGKMHRKNKVRETNDWLTGECDLQETLGKDKIITDIKVSWNSESYDNTLSLKSVYGYQVGVGYGWLYGSTINRVVHCLVNTPIELLKPEMYQFLMKYKPVGMPMLDFEFSDEGIILRTQFFRNHIVSDDGWVTHLDGTNEYLKEGYWEKLVHDEMLDSTFKFVPIPEKQRVKIFQFKRDESKIDYIKSKLVLARDEINRLLDKDEVEFYDLSIDDCDN